MSNDQKNSDNSQPAEKTENIHEILNNIKNVITGNTDSQDTLVLTDQVPSQPPVADIQPVAAVAAIADAQPAESAQPAATPDTSDILAQLDATDNAFASSPTPPPSPITTQQQPQPPASNPADVAVAHNIAPHTRTISQGHEIKHPEHDSQAPSFTTLINDQVSNSVQSSIASLIDNAAKINSYELNNMSNLSSKILEDLVKSLIEPKLEVWLNDNLEQIVRSIVEQELKRILPK